MRVVVVSLAFVVSLGWPGASAGAQESIAPIASPTGSDLQSGRRVFEAQCGRCHGRDGSGGSGPSLQRPRLRKAPDDATLLVAIREGLRGTSMPGNFQISGQEVRLVGAYVRSLGRVAPEPLRGDPTRGAALFSGKGGCAACHVVSGQGGPHGPDLGDVGAVRGASHLRQSILDPTADLPSRVVPYEPSTYPAFLPVRAALMDGREVRGYRVNEDSFTIQLRDASGVLYSLRKTELRTLDKLVGQSTMPSYRSLLTDSEVDDLVAYLAGQRGE